MDDDRSAPRATATGTDRPVIGLLTDFGQTDGYVGVMKAVMLGIAPHAALVDLSHEIAPQDIEMGAWALEVSWRYFPLGSVLLCVVDPGVGSARRAIAIETHGRRFVGPDNGLFTYLLDAAESDARARCVSLDDSRYHLPSTSATFHGRDIFAPCAAHLAAGLDLAALGAEVDLTSLARLSIARQPERRGASYRGRVAHVDHYGNLITNISGDLARETLAHPSTYLSLAVRSVRARANHFAAGPAETPFFVLDSSGALAIVVRDGSAARTLGAGRGDDVWLHGLGGASADGPEARELDE